MKGRKLVSLAVITALSAFTLGVVAHDRDDDDRFKPVDPALVKARQKFFGIENVDERGQVKKDKVIVSWATNTTYMVSLKGRVFMLDSYVSRPELQPAGIDTRYTPFLPRDAADARPEPTSDVLFGSIVSLGAGNNQQRDIIKVIQHLKPKVYYPGHLTDVAQRGSALYHKINWRETATNMGFPQSEWPEFRLQVDPNDFAVPQVFDPDDERWQERGKSSRMHDMCR